MSGTAQPPGEPIPASAGSWTQTLGRQVLSISAFLPLGPRGCSAEPRPTLPPVGTLDRRHDGTCHTALVSVHTHTHTRVRHEHMHTCVHCVYTRTHVCVRACACMCTHVHMCVRARVYTCVHAHTHTGHTLTNPLTDTLLITPALWGLCLPHPAPPAEHQGSASPVRVPSSPDIAGSASSQSQSD